MKDAIELTDIKSEISVSEARSMVILHEGLTYKYFDEGCTRFVFTNDNMTKVIKLEKSTLNSYYNRIEKEIYDAAAESDKQRMAKTSLIGNYIEQEFVTPIKFGGIKLNAEQREFAQQCRNEVGWNSEGELVCFDLDEYMKY